MGGKHQADGGLSDEAAKKRNAELVDPSRDPNPGVPNHAAEEGADLHPLIDLSRDPNPGKADHAAPED